MLPFIAGLIVGGLFGVVAMCLLLAAKVSDRQVEYPELVAQMDDAPQAALQISEKCEVPL